MIRKEDFEKVDLHGPSESVAEMLIRSIKQSQAQETNTTTKKSIENCAGENIFGSMRVLLLALLAGVLGGCVHSSEVAEDGPNAIAINEREAKDIANLAAARGGWQVLDVRPPERRKNKWVVHVIRLEKGFSESEVVVVSISADGKRVRLNAPLAGTFRDLRPPNLRR